MRREVKKQTKSEALLTDAKPEPPGTARCGRCGELHEVGKAMRNHVCERHVRSSLPQARRREKKRKVEEDKKRPRKRGTRSRPAVRVRGARGEGAGAAHRGADRERGGVDSRGAGLPRGRSGPGPKQRKRGTKKKEARRGRCGAGRAGRGRALRRAGGAVGGGPAGGGPSRLRCGLHVPPRKEEEKEQREMVCAGTRGTRRSR